MASQRIKLNFFPIVTLVLTLITSSISCNRKSENSKEATKVVPAASSSNAPTEPPTPGAPRGPIKLVYGPELVESIVESTAKATLVNAWASWCGPCRREFPMLVALRDSLSAMNVDVLFVSVDDPETHGAALEFAEQRGVKPPLLFAKRPLGPFKAAMSRDWPGMLPATFLFDANGKLRYFWGGPVYEEELLPIIEGFLAGKDIDGVARVGLRRGKDFRAD